MRRRSVAGGGERAGTCRFFAENMISETAALKSAVVDGAASLAAADAA